MAVTFDLIIVGGGINGAAIACAAARAGQAVLLLEQEDFGAGATSASTRLIHGGLRYLEHGEIGLVRESLQERRALLDSVPHLVQPLKLFIPVYTGGRRNRWEIRVGLSLYSLLSPRSRLPRYAMLSSRDLSAAIPGLAAEGLVGGGCYYDAQISFPERLVIENLLDAVQRGAQVHNHSRVTRVVVRDNAVAGVEWRNQSGVMGVAHAAVVVNAGGPWVDEVNGTMGGGDAHPARLVGGTKGSHLVVERFPGAPDAALYTEAAADGRPFFIVPWNGLYLIGTTDLHYEGDPADAAISDTEFAYLVAETERLFPQCGGIAQYVVATQSGVRPLPYAPGKEAGAVTRRHLIHAHTGARGLYSVIGGKLTTHRSLARDVVGRLAHDRVIHCDREADATSADLAPLPGFLSSDDRQDLLRELAQQVGGNCAERLWHVYGGQARQLLARIANDASLATVVRPLPGNDDRGEGAAARLLRVELLHAVETEWAVTLTDILRRRCMTGLDADCGVHLAQPAAAALCALGVWDEARATKEVTTYFAGLSRMRVRALRDATPRPRA